MKGIIFNLLEDAVDRDQGEGTWDRVLEAAQVTGVYTSLGSYDDAELMRLMAVTARLSGRSMEASLRWFGGAALPMMAERYPVFFVGHTSTETFLPTLNDVIHREVRKIYAGADVPDFSFAYPAPGRLVMSYASTRGMCMFAEGLIDGAARHYGEVVELAQTECCHRGDARCVFEVVVRRGAS